MTKTHRNVAGTAEASFHRHYAAIWGEERWKTSLFPALARPTRYACLINRHTADTQSSQDLRSQLMQDGCETITDFPHLEQRSPDDGRFVCYVRGSYDVLDDEAGRDLKTFNPFPPPSSVQVGGESLLTHWNLDAASVLVATMLDVIPGDKVLDMCAAPGGKSIALAQRLWAQPTEGIEAEQRLTSILHSNEIDNARNRRLTENIRSYLPYSISGENPRYKQLRIPGARSALTLRIDGTQSGAADQFPLSASVPCSSSFLSNEAGRRNVGYDKVLVDAPCSSERHIIHAQETAKASGRVAVEMANWRPGSSKRLIKLQVELLMTAFRVARVGATIVYATCSIEMAENDGVIKKMLAEVQKERKKGAQWDVGRADSAMDDDANHPHELNHWAEKTEHGWIVLPDHPKGGMWGPLFFSIFRKVIG